MTTEPMLRSKTVAAEQLDSELMSLQQLHHKIYHIIPLITGAQATSAVNQVVETRFMVLYWTPRITTDAPQVEQNH